MENPCIQCRKDGLTSSEIRECANHPCEELETWLSSSRAKQLEACLRDLKRGSCWCDAGVGNPMVKGHTDVCLRVQKLLGGN